MRMNENSMKVIRQIENLLEGQPQYIKGFYHYMKTSGRTSSVKTQKEYLAHVINFFKQTNKEPEDVDMDDITQYLSDVSIKEDGEPVSGTYLMVVYSALNKFFSYMKANKKIENNPVDGVERPKPKPSNQIQRTYLTQEEIYTCLMYLDLQRDFNRERNLAIFGIFITTGIRLSAMENIDIDDVDLEKGTIDVFEKGGKKRKVYIPDTVVKFIKEWLEVRETKMIGYKTSNALFITKRRTRMTHTAISNMIDKVCSSIAERHITPHKLRYTAANQALNAGATLYDIQNFLGHSSPTVTTQCYLQESESSVKKTSKLLSENMGL